MLINLIHSLVSQRLMGKEKLVDQDIMDQNIVDQTSFEMFINRTREVKIQ